MSKTRICWAYNLMYYQPQLNNALKLPISKIGEAGMIYLITINFCLAVSRPAFISTI
jgi:hypothetical protein